MTFDEDDDYVEEVRGYFYPKLHLLLADTPLYAVGQLTDGQHVGYLDEDEDTIEEELVSVGFVRNPVACYKSHPDGRESEGSWVLLDERDSYGVLGGDRQLHVTLMERDDGEKGREVFAHEEYDWRHRPVAHLRGADFERARAIAVMRDLIDDETFLLLE